MDFTYKLTNEEIKNFLEKVFELDFIRFKEGPVMGGRGIVVKSMLAEHAYSMVVFQPYEIEISAMGILPEEHKGELKTKGVDEKGGLVHLQGKDLYDEYFSLMLKKAYDLGVLREYKNELIEYWTERLTEEKDKLINLPVWDKIMKKNLGHDWVEEFKKYIEKKCEEVLIKGTDSGR